MSGTPIDAARAALEAAGDDAGLRMAFYGQVLAAELYVLLEAEPEGERLRPLVLETEAGRLVLAFDLPERMAAFLTAPKDYIAVAGRSLVAMLAGQGIGIALNPEVAPSASVIGPEAVDWLAEAGRPVTAEPARIIAFREPADVPAALVRMLEFRLGAYAGRVSAAYLARAEYEGGGEGLVLAVAGVPGSGEAAVAAAIDEAVRFSGADGVRLDVIFPGEAALARISRVGIAFRPEPPEQPRRQPQAPGSDPARPPRLR
ncbi:MAG TPA: SseB family protein [Paracoccaceae bacterium]|nr:SseB family protein [Paracoccaceae bacterium]